MNVPDIVFVGKAGAGKTTASKLLAERLPNLGYKTISFAEPLKVMLDTQTDRQRLQEFGTDVVRAYDPQAWVRLFFWHLELRTQIRREHAGWDNTPGASTIRWCNDDCRFENEIGTLLDHGWAVIEVQADEQVRIDRLKRNGKWADGMLDHKSENALGPIVPHGVIINNGESLDNVTDQLVVILRRLSS